MSTRDNRNSHFKFASLDKIELYGLLDDADVFLQFYSILLARRLIHDNYNHYNEGVMISKLKQVCSYDQIYKMQRMFKDIDVSQDLNEEFQQLLARSTQHPPGISKNFSVMVLTYGSWPYFHVSSTFSPPRELSAAMNAFEQMYREVHKGRKLMWLPNHSRGIVRMHTHETTFFDLQVTAIQLILLLQYEDKEVASIRQLMDAAGLPLEECLPVVDSLIKCRLLRWRGKESESMCDALPMNAQIVFNKRYSSKHRKIAVYKYLTSAGGHTGTAVDPESYRKAMEQVSEDRKYATQACIVRLMKSKKRMEHSALVSEVLLHLQSVGRGFARVTLSDIKRNIDVLIEQEFVARVGDGNTYEYLA